jgi:hypothetical protein
LETIVHLSSSNVKAKGKKELALSSTEPCGQVPCNVLKWISSSFLEHQVKLKGMHDRGTPVRVGKLRGKVLIATF